MGPFKKIINICGNDYMLVIEFYKKYFIYNYDVEIYSRNKYDPAEAFLDYESAYTFSSFRKPIEALKQVVKAFEQELIAEEEASKRKKEFEDTLKEWDGEV